jgi:hypothetical protein
MELKKQIIWLQDSIYGACETNKIASAFNLWNLRSRLYGFKIQPMRHLEKKVVSRLDQLKLKSKVHGFKTEYIEIARTILWLQYSLNWTCENVIKISSFSVEQNGIHMS